MGKIVITIMAFSAVASMSSVASAQTIVLDRMDIKVAQLGGVESYRPSGQLFIGKTLSQVRVAITFGTFDANGSFAAYPDATCGSILINPPAPAGGLKWIILDPITIKPNRAGLRVCQAELQYKLGGIVWVPYVEADVWPPVVAVFLRWLTGARDLPDDAVQMYHFLYRHKTVTALQVLN